MCTPNTGEVYFIEGHAKGPVSGYLRILGQRWTCKIRQQGKRKAVSIALISFLSLLSLLRAMSIIIRRRERGGINGQLEGFSHKIFNKSSFIALPTRGHFRFFSILFRSCVISKAQCIGMWLFTLAGKRMNHWGYVIKKQCAHDSRDELWSAKLGPLLGSSLLVAKRMSPEVIYSVWRVPFHLHVVNH